MTKYAWICLIGSIIVIVFEFIDALDLTQAQAFIEGWQYLIAIITALMLFFIAIRRKQ